MTARAFFPTPACLILLLFAGCGGSPERQAARGIEALNRGEPARAERFLSRALRDDADGRAPALWWEALGLARGRLQQPGPAEEALRLALDREPDAYAPRYNLGALLVMEGRLEEAATQLRLAAADTSRTEALELLANLALESGATSGAVDLLEQARTRSPSSRVLNALALARRQDGAPAESVRDLLQQAVVLDPDYPPAQLNLAALLDDKRLDPVQASTHYNAFLRLEPDSPRSFAVRQRLQVLAERIATGGVAAPDPLRGEVEDLLRQAADLQRAGDQPRALHVCLRAAASASRAQRKGLEERALRAAATLVPDSPRGHAALGRFLLQQGRHGAALTSFQRSLSLAPDWPIALEGVVQAAVAGRQTSLARDTLQRAEAAAADNPELLLMVATLHRDSLNDRGRARRVAQDWLRRFTGHARTEEARAFLSPP